ncbi:MAG: hypothetical protein ACE5MI_14335 [Acidimicrobiia bacterium]
MSRSFARDDGFTLSEAAVALAVLAIGILMTITPVMAALGGLHRAKLVSIASNLAQAQLEEVRSLPYLDVGFPSSSPAGVLSPTKTVTLQGVDFLVTTEVEFVGSITGLNIMPGGGDGVPSVGDLGVDYKRVSITISHPTGAVSPVIMDTIVAPPNLAAHEGKVNVIVNLLRANPSGVPDPATNPKVCLTRDTLPDIISSSTNDTQIIAILDPNEPDPAKPNYWYYIRLSPTGCDIEGGFPEKWRIHPDDLFNQSERVHTDATQTVSAAITIYRPSTIEISIVEKEDGDPIETNAYLYVEHDGGTEVYDQGSQTVKGTWKLTTIDGAPIVPGLFTFTVMAEDRLPTVVGALVPSGYPTDLDHVEVIGMAQSSSSTSGFEIEVKDEYSNPMTGAIVSFTNPLWGTMVLVTDETGKVYTHLPQDEDVDVLEVVSPYGHDPHTQASWAPEDRTVTLNTPSGYGAILFEKSGQGIFGFRDSGSPDDYQHVLPNSNDKATAAVPPGTYEVTKLCYDGSVAVSGTVTISAGSTTTWGASDPECP